MAFMLLQRLVSARHFHTCMLCNAACPLGSSCLAFAAHTPMLPTFTTAFWRGSWKPDNRTGLIEV